MTITAEKSRFFESMKNHQIACSGTSWFSLPVILLASENTYLSYPIRGVIRFAEQGVDLSVIKAIFHCLHDDGSLGAPVEVKRPTFTYDPR